MMNEILFILTLTKINKIPNQMSLQFARNIKQSVSEGLAFDTDQEIIVMDQPYGYVYRGLQYFILAYMLI